MATGGVVAVPTTSEMRLAASDLLEVLLWFADDECILLGGIPIQDKAQTPGPEIVRLQSFYLPHRRLPEPGQGYWRDIQGMIDLDLTKRTEPLGSPEEIIRFHKSLDSLIGWVVDEYTLGELTPRVSTEPTPPQKRQSKPDPAGQRTLLLALLFQRHVDGVDGKQFEPFTQGQLKKSVTVRQSTISRWMASWFPNGGMKKYGVLCRTRTIVEHVRRLERSQRKRDLRDPMTKSQIPNPSPEGAGIYCGRTKPYSRTTPRLLRIEVDGPPFPVELAIPAAGASALLR